MSSNPWAGVDFKLAEAEFFLTHMGKELVPPRHRSENRGFHAWMASGHGTTTWFHHAWQENFYYYLDAFLVATRSVPDIIQKCFGCDPRSKQWVEALPTDEQTRRKKFQARFRPLYLDFSKLPASTARSVTAHGMGTPPVEVRLTGWWGVEYLGGPQDRLPTLETRHIVDGGDPPSQLVAATATMPLEPYGESFTLKVDQPDGSVLSVPLFPECKKYREQACDLAAHARKFEQEVHAGARLTPPPKL